MNYPQLGRILLVNCLLSSSVNALFYSHCAKSMLASLPIALLLGLGLYTTQTLVTYYLLRHHRTWLWRPFGARALVQGIGALLIVELLTLTLLRTVSVSSPVADLPQRVAAFLPVFLLNAVPGASVEEWLFRYLPLHFAAQSPKWYWPVLLGAGALVLFTFVHLPAYLWQYDLSLRDLVSVFVMGLYFLLVYLATQNLPFTILLHALSNKPLYLVESPFHGLYFYISVGLVSASWALLRRRKAQNHVSKETVI